MISERLADAADRFRDEQKERALNPRDHDDYLDPDDAPLVNTLTDEQLDERINDHQREVRFAQDVRALRGLS